MKIDNINNIPNYNSIPSDKAVKKTVAEEKASYNTDRVEIGIRMTAEDENLSIKDSILRSEKQGISPERLEALKQKISQNQYYVSTEEIVKSIF